MNFVVATILALILCVGNVMLSPITGPVVCNMLGLVFGAALGHFFVMGLMLGWDRWY